MWGVPKGINHSLYMHSLGRYPYSRNHPIRKCGRKCVPGLQLKLSIIPFGHRRHSGEFQLTGQTAMEDRIALHIPLSRPR